MTGGNVVLDLDGTLLDSRQRHIVVLTDCVNQINTANYTCENFSDFIVYKSAGNTGLMYLESKGIPNAKEIIALWIKKIEYKRYLQLDVLYPDALLALEALHSRYNLFLITARANKTNAVWQLSKLDIAKYFDDIMIVKNTKDAAVNKYNVIKHTPLAFVIGDTEVDKKLAEYARCTFYPLNQGFRSQKYWEQCAHTQIYNSLSEIVKQIKK